MGILFTWHLIRRHEPPRDWWLIMISESYPYSGHTLYFRVQLPVHLHMCLVVLVALYPFCINTYPYQGHTLSFRVQLWVHLHIYGRLYWFILHRHNFYPTKIPKYRTNRLHFWYQFCLCATRNREKLLFDINLLLQNEGTSSKIVRDKLNNHLPIGTKTSVKHAHSIDFSDHFYSKQMKITFHIFLTFLLGVSIFVLHTFHIFKHDKY